MASCNQSHVLCSTRWKDGAQASPIRARHGKAAVDAKMGAKQKIGVASPTWARLGQAAGDAEMGAKQNGGAIKRLVLNNESRTKLNPSSDRAFYTIPRFVTHVDDAFLHTLTLLYRQRIPPNAEILDLMSSWVSHLPKDITYKRVVGHGLNAAELARNRRLDTFFVKDLNQDPFFEAGDSSFDAVICTVSVQYLQQPEKVFAEIYRILRPGGVCIVSFSNRMFYEKAITAWREGTSVSRTQLVVQYFQCVDGFTAPEVIRGMPQPDQASSNSSSSPLNWLFNLFKSTQKDPFYAVVAYRNFKPI